MVGVQTTSALVTGEAVAVDLRIARAGSRLVAALIDLLVEAVVYGLLAVLPLALITRGRDPALIGSIGTVTFIAVFVGYPVTMETLTGRTLGKLALGLRVLRDDGGPVRFRQAFARGLVGLFVEKPGITLGAAGLISCIVSSQAKRLGDLTAGTIVVQERVPAPAGLTVSMPPALAGWATSLDMSGLPPGLLLSARQYLARSPSLAPGARDRLGGRLAHDFAARITPPAPEGTPPQDYLMAVLAERRVRSDALQPPAGGAGATTAAAAGPDPAPGTTEGGFVTPR